MWHSYLMLCLPLCQVLRQGWICVISHIVSHRVLVQARLMQAVSGEQQSAKDSYERIYKRRSLPALRSSGAALCYLSFAWSDLPFFKRKELGRTTALLIDTFPVKAYLTLCRIPGDSVFIPLTDWACQYRHDADRHWSFVGHQSLPTVWE